jgi:hypothetical protein
MDKVTNTIKLIVIYIVALAVIGLSSCRMTRPAGCPDTWGKVGYR